MNDLVRNFKRCRLFESLSDSEAEPVVRRARVRAFPRGAVIYSPVDSRKSIMVLVSGLVKIKIRAARVDGSHAAGGGRGTILAFIVEGDLFGELSLLSGEPRRDSAEAVEDSQVLVLPRAALLSLLEGRADLALAFARLIGQRRARGETRHADLLFLASRERVVLILCELAESHGNLSGNRVEIRLPLSHQDIAELIGVSRETATIALGELQAAGLVEMSRRRIAIADVRGLQRVATGTTVSPSSTPVRDKIRKNSWG